MTSHDERRASQLPASSDRYEPDKVTTALSSGRKIVRSSIQSVRLPGMAHHRARASQICIGGKQNRPRTSSTRRIQASPYAFFTGPSCQYWGRRRHGPARQVFRMA